MMSTATDDPVRGRAAPPPPPPAGAKTSKLAEAVPDWGPVTMNAWTPRASPARIDHVNVTLPLASATCVPRASGDECCSAVTTSPGWKP